VGNPSSKTERTIFSYVCPPLITRDASHLFRSVYCSSTGGQRKLSFRHKNIYTFTTPIYRRTRSSHNEN